MSTARLAQATAAAVLLVASIAAVVSFVHIQRLAVTHGQTELAAYLLPVSVDGTVAAASLVMLRAARAGLGTPVLARTMLGLAVAATLAANVAYGVPYGLTGALLSGWPAVAFIGCAEMAIGMVRRQMYGTTSAHEVAADATPPRAALYRLFGTNDELLYVGITLSPAARLKEHSWRKPWWPEVQRHEIEWHENWHAAAAAEQAAIEAEGPKYNISKRLDPGPDARRQVPQTALEAARAAYVASVDAGNPLSARAVSERFGISRRRADQIRAQVAQELPAAIAPRWPSRGERATRTAERTVRQSVLTDSPAGASAIPPAPGPPAGVSVNGQHPEGGEH
jgi:hypothetical protein